MEVPAMTVTAFEVVNVLTGVLLFTELTSRPVQSVSCDVCMLYQNYVPSVYDWNQESWRLLVKERIANMGN